MGMSAHQSTGAKSNAKTGLMAASLAIAMVGMGFAAVPLYKIFCQVTGFGGTTMRVSEAKAATIQSTNQTIVVRFDANQRGLPWEFKPERPTDTVTVGARDMSIFLAKNNAAVPITGSATFNVTPERAGKYFNNSVFLLYRADAESRCAGAHAGALLCRSGDPDRSGDKGY